MKNLELLVLIFIILESFLITLIWTISCKLKSIKEILIKMKQIKIRYLDE